MRPTGKILIIDDDPSFLRLYQNQLGEEGYLVDTATDAAAALSKLDQSGWDAVLIDQKLQGSAGPDSGLDLVAEVTRRAPGAKAILGGVGASDPRRLSPSGGLFPQAGLAAPLPPPPTEIPSSAWDKSSKSHAYSAGWHTQDPSSARSVRCSFSVSE